MKISSLILVVTLTGIFPVVTFAKESCALKDLELETSSRAERLYFEGTCHYRNKDYSDSVRLWKELSKLETVKPEDAALKIDVLNNLGYMLFFGYGVKADQREALGLWHKAVGMGHTESEFHLCHAYADADESTYDPIKAIGHCDKAELVYLGMEEKDKDEKEILRQIQNYKKQLKRQRK
jgi:TPR repeat protein